MCIICREEMTAGCKKLPCNHIFHTSCLRSWFQRQQICPTCRMDVLRAPSARRPQQQQQQPQQPPQGKIMPCHQIWYTNIVTGSVPECMNIDIDVHLVCWLDFLNVQKICIAGPYQRLVCSSLSEIFVTYSMLTLLVEEIYAPLSRKKINSKTSNTNLSSCHDRY